MKSGLTCVLAALAAVESAIPGWLARTPLRFLCNSDEEVGSPSSAPLIRQLATRTSLALVFEAGRRGDAIVTRRRGGALFEVVAHGRAAHAGNDHRSGANAIHGLARLVPRIEALTAYERGVTLNVGTFHGGTAKNTVPEQARCEVDARFETTADARTVEESLRAMTSDPWGGAPPPAGLAGVTFTLTGGVTRPPMERGAGTAGLLERYARWARAVGLGGDEAPLQGGGSDANLLAAEGVAVLDGLGPAGEFFHQTTEWSSLDSLRRRTQALALFLVAELGP
jgi:glutamate carboxypeptidase